MGVIYKFFLQACPNPKKHYYENCVTLHCATKSNLDVQKQASEACLLNKCLHYATASGVTKLTMTIIVNLVTLFVPLEFNVDV
jgi:hypothetical protein